MAPVLRSSKRKGSPSPMNFKVPPDPLRLDFPYTVGARFSVQRHVPPPPFGIGYTKETNRLAVDRWKQPDTTQTEWCLQYPPLDSPPHADASTHTLEIVGSIACQDGRGAQVVRCRLDDSEQVYAAKIYDALYYPWISQSGILDITWRADRDYRCESTAYETLCEAGVDGNFAPKYYGSWTFNVTVPFPSGPVSRPLRMVLMEWIQGDSMAQLIQTGEVYSIPVEKRLDILAMAMEYDERLTFHGVLHNDPSPRNVVVTGWNGSAAETETPKVYFVDFNVAYAVYSPYYRTPYLRPALPRNPMDFSWYGPLEDFRGWLPTNYRNSHAFFRGWMKSRWYGSKDFLPFKIRRERGVETIYVPPESDSDEGNMLQPAPSTRIY